MERYLWMNIEYKEIQPSLSYCCFYSKWVEAVFCGLWRMQFQLESLNLNPKALTQFRIVHAENKPRLGFPHRGSLALTPTDQTSLYHNFFFFCSFEFY